MGFAVISFLAVCFYFWRTPAFSLFHPLTWYLACHGILFVFRPIVVRIRGYDFIYHVYQFMPSASDKLTVILASTLGMLSFALFSLRSGNAAMRFVDTEAKRIERRQLSRIFVYVLLICGPPAAYSLFNSFGEDNNFTGMMLDRATGVTINTVKNGYVTDLQLMAVSLCPLLIWVTRFRWWSFAPLVGFALVRAGTGGRGPFVAALVGAALFYLYEKRIRFPGIKAVFGAVLLLGAFSAVGNDRGLAIRKAFNLDDTSTIEVRDLGLQFMEGMDFGNMEYFEYLVYVVPQRSGTYDYFLDNLQVFTEPVPRILWTGKPIGEPFRQIELFQYGFPIGMTRSLPGEGWYALGWLGVLIWCGLWGYGLGWIYNRFAKGSQTTLATAAYMVFLPILIVALRDGILLTIVREAGAYLMPIFIWHLLARYFGIPSAARITAMLARQRGGQASPVTGAEPALAAIRADLPPAVRRRRAALAGTSTATPE
ncbi:oligosaccharide repeat unit polymerase [Novosphingobium flavum]|uniref:Oligosaccharide repeat unit polymerase n=1 Tax=Novosphingobium flavum TaxID=1778672 RepID=A0A7X1KKF6_9SPHN|nr:O-antigen polymerase [Novosphingobium flavum]MBC2664452.1 oligosaccharide repeat unit polymerase [Novosphingobium flavum]